MTRETPSITVAITESNGRQSEVSLSRPTVRLGRDPGSELSFDEDANQGVSWNHALIELGPEGAWAVDCGSTNGTFVNATKLTERTLLGQGDVVRLGVTGPQIKIACITLPSPQRDSIPEPVKNVSPSLGEKSHVESSKDPAQVPSSSSGPSLAVVVLAAMASLVGIAAIALALVVVLKQDSSEQTIATGKSENGDKAQKPKVEDPKVEDPKVESVPEARLSPEEISRKWQRCVFWVAGSRGDETIPCCTAWAVGPNLLATAASNMGFLEALQEAEYAVSVATDLEARNVIGVVHMELYPKSDAEPSKRIVLLQLQEPLTIRTDEIPGIEGSERALSDPTITTLGFALPRDGGRPVPLSQNHRVERLVVTGRLVGSPATGPCSYRVASPLPRSISGSPVFSSDGEVVGVLDVFEQCVVSVNIVAQAVAKHVSPSAGGVF